MIFSKKLIKGRILNCYNNLILDVELENNKKVSVFCPDFESGKKLYTQGKEVLIKRTVNKLYKLKYEIVMIKENDSFIMINYKFIPKIFEEAFEKDVFEELLDYPHLTSLKPDSNHKHVTFELYNKKNNKKCYIYLCSVYNKVDADIVFPSYLDFREMNVYNELAELRKKGLETYVFLIAPRVDTNSVKFVWNLDPIGAAKTYDEAKNGLKFVCYGCNLDKNGIEISNKIKIEF
ncbi:MAG: DNA/RNA nuclease SfsA [Alphaproteobacteria bacterium]